MKKEEAMLIYLTLIDKLKEYALGNLRNMQSEPLGFSSTLQETHYLEEITLYANDDDDAEIPADALKSLDSFEEESKGKIIIITKEIERMFSDTINKYMNNKTFTIDSCIEEINHITALLNDKINCFTKDFSKKAKELIQAYKNGSFYKKILITSSNVLGKKGLIHEMLNKISSFSKDLIDKLQEKENRNDSDFLSQISNFFEKDIPNLLKKISAHPRK